MPPYLIVRWTSATIEPMYRAPYALGLKHKIFCDRLSPISWFDVHMFKTIVTYIFCLKILS